MEMFMGKFYVLLFLLVVVVVEGQQAYINNFDCYNQTFNTTAGFTCNGVESSCQSYLTFRSNPPYNSALNISHLLASEAGLIASINQLPSVYAIIPVDTLVVVPVNCSCSGQYYQHNATYNIVENTAETSFSVANDTYQGLTTCQAIMAQNTKTPNPDLLVPLRCACPTRNQTASGVKHLLTYILWEGDTTFSIAEIFHVERQSLLDANELSRDDLIPLYPFMTVLVPLTAEPTKIEQPAVPPPSPFPFYNLKTSLTTPCKKGYLFEGIGIGAGSLLLVELLVLFCFYYRRSKSPKPGSSSGPKMLLQGFQNVVKSLTVFKFQNVQTATANFSQDNRIKGSVYRGTLAGDIVVIKAMKRDVSSEINILKKISHSNIIRLSGFCVHENHTYLVYECATNGSLGDWLHSKEYQTSATLQWKQRVQIAYDVANGLDYLHEYTDPPYIHKNLKSSNILLDANFRAKLSNFTLARPVSNSDQGCLQFTGHVVGTRGYMAPEYTENGVITPKLDVFALGVVILELLSGREAATAADANSGDDLLSACISRVLEGDDKRGKLRGFMDPSLRNEYPFDLAFSMAQLAKSCVANDLNARPSISQVSIALSNILSESDWYPYGEGSMLLSGGR